MKWNRLAGGGCKSSVRQRLKRNSGVLLLGVSEMARIGESVVHLSETLSSCAWWIVTNPGRVPVLIVEPHSRRFRVWVSVLIVPYGSEWIGVGTWSCPGIDRKIVPRPA